MTQKIMINSINLNVTNILEVIKKTTQDHWPAQLTNINEARKLAAERWQLHVFHKSKQTQTKKYCNIDACI